MLQINAIQIIIIQCMESLSTYYISLYEEIRLFKNRGLRRNLMANKSW